MALPKKIFVTGAAVRTGREIACLLATSGAEVVLHANTHFTELEKLLTALPGSGHSAICGNFSDDRDVAKLAECAAGCDGIVLNASCYRHNYSGGDAKFDLLLEKVNFLSQIRIIEGFISGNKSGGGAVVAMLDQAIASKEDNPYLVSRRALWQKMKDFAVEYGKYGLRFNAVAPGPMIPPPELGNTGMVKTIPTLPLQRSVLLEDAAESVAFLLSCSSITGSLLFVDCGQSLNCRNGVI